MSDDRDPYAEGAEAHAGGVAEAANPHVGIDGTAEASWNDGWANAAVAASEGDDGIPE